MADRRGDLPDDPTSSSEPEHEPGTISMRPVALVAAILAIAAIAFLSYRCVKDSGSDATFTDQVTRYAPSSVTYVALGRSYLVRQADGTFLALSEIEAADADRVAGCVIRFRPDLSAGDQTGVFRDDCHGALFDREGRAVQGDAPPMQRQVVTTNGNQLMLRVKACISGDGRQQPQTCRE